jgi:hypothetical protein
MPAFKLSFDRIPGVPLLSHSNNIVRSLHPDIVSLLPQPGDSLGLPLIAHSLEPTVESALPESCEMIADREWRLLWTMDVVWQNEIVKWRGYWLDIRDCTERLC